MSNDQRSCEKSQKKLSDIMDKETYCRMRKEWDSCEAVTDDEIERITDGWREIAMRRLLNVLEFDGSVLDYEWDWFDESCWRDGLMEACAQLEMRVRKILQG